MSVEDAAGTAIATAGQAVLFAGTTVVIAILGLFLAGLPAISAMGAPWPSSSPSRWSPPSRCSPACSAWPARRSTSCRSTARPTSPSPPTRPSPAAGRTTSAATRCATPSPASAPCAPSPSRRSACGSACPTTATPPTTRPSASPSTSSPRASARVQRPDPGRRRGPSRRRGRAVDRVHDALQADPGVAAVTGRVQRRRRHRRAHRQPDHGPQDEAPTELVRHLRTDVLPAAVEGTDAKVSLTGRAMVTDLTDRISNRLPVFIAAVVAMSFLLLMIVFRSVLVPLKAAIMNLLSIAAAYGVLVAVFQWGWGTELIGLHSTMPINPFLPLIMFAILFGLSMDYEVFLLSRVREEYVATGDNHEAVVRGLSSTARVITSAALIMISVFGAFVLSDDPNGKLFGSAWPSPSSSTPRWSAWSWCRRR